MPRITAAGCLAVAWIAGAVLFVGGIDPISALAEYMH